jgi:DNA-binding GntR family transcriptional regulator
LIEMIEAGDVDGAVAHWEQHLQQAADLALERLGHTTVVDLLDHPLGRR